MRHTGQVNQQLLQFILKSGLDTTAQVNAMLNEEIDFVQLSGTQGADISRFEAQSDKFDIQQFDQGRLFYLYINPDAAGETQGTAKVLWSTSVCI